MTVVILRLSGLDVTAALDEVNRLLSDREKYPQLHRTLVIDDTAALLSHAVAFERLLKSRRLDHVLCVAVGPGSAPPPGAAPEHDVAQTRRIWIPPTISNSHGSAMLWVSDPCGIDWRLSAAATADGHAGNPADGLECLVDVVSADDVFDKVLALVRGVRGGVASPGLHLADADDEAAAFPASLAVAMQRLTEAGSGPATGGEAPFAPLIPGATGMAELAAGGELASHRDWIADAVATTSAALAKPAGGLFRRAAPNFRTDVIAVGNQLRTFRDRISRLFTEAHTTGEPTAAQLAAVGQAGVRLPVPLGSPKSVDRTDGADSGPTPVRQLVADAIRSGDTLPRVMRRLTLTGQQLRHPGSGAYLPEVDKACPPGLLSRLAAPAERPPGKAAAHAWRHGLGLAEAAAAADGLAALVVRVATREWSGTATVASEVFRTRIALDGISKTLAQHAVATGTPSVTGVRAARRARLVETLTPILCDLVDKVIAVESAAPSTGGQNAFERAQDKTADLIADWAAHAAENGATSRPAFATSDAQDYAHALDDMATLRETLAYDPAARMWQLCEPDDLGALEVTQPPRVVAFASRLNKEALGDGVPDDITWTASGSHAGLLRLVPLRPGTLRAEWPGGSTPDERDEPPEPAS